MENEKLERIHAYIEETQRDVTVTEVRQKFGLTWPTARVLLLRLVADGKLEMRELVPRGCFFRAKRLTEMPVAEVKLVKVPLNRRRSQPSK